MLAVQKAVQKAEIQYIRVRISIGNSMSVKQQVTMK